MSGYILNIAGLPVLLFHTMHISNCSREIGLTLCDTSSFVSHCVLHSLTIAFAYHLEGTGNPW